MTPEERQAIRDRAADSVATREECKCDPRTLGSGKLPEHGTRARYLSRRSPCKCERCSAANAAYWRKQRAS